MQENHYLRLKVERDIWNTKIRKATEPDMTAVEISKSGGESSRMAI